MAPMSQAGWSQDARVVVPAPPCAPQITNSRRCHPAGTRSGAMPSKGGRSVCPDAFIVVLTWFRGGRGSGQCWVSCARPGRRLAARFFGGDAEQFQQAGGGDAVVLADADDAAGELIAAGEVVGLG